MYAPIFLPKAPAPSPAVLAAERAILDIEGPHHVAGRYYASASDAAIWRRLAAERAVRDAERRTNWLARHPERGGVDADHGRAA